MVRQVVVSLALIGLGCVLAGVYGAVHNQVSYSIGPEYFYVIKFDQFGIPAGLRNRVGAALVGFLASWWMGAIIGGVLVPIALVRGRGRLDVGVLLRAYGVVVGTALLVGLCGIFVGLVLIRPEIFSPIREPGGGPYLDDPTGFYRAGLLHNASYAGWVFGIVAGGIYLVRRGRGRLEVG